MSRLIALPTEIRLMIWWYLVPCEYQIEFHMRWDNGNDSPGKDVADYVVRLGLYEYERKSVTLE